MTRKTIWPLAVLLISATGVLNPAAAGPTEWIFAFTETSASQPYVSASATMILDNAAYRDGVSVNRESSFDPATSNLLGTGIDSLSISVPFFTATLDEFVASDPSFENFPSWFVNLSSGPSGVPTGEIFFINMLDNTGFDFVLGNPSSTISVGSDIIPCAIGNCIVTGTWALVGSVPEPASLALLASGVLGLAALRRRRSVGNIARFPAP